MQTRRAVDVRTARNPLGGPTRAALLCLLLATAGACGDGDGETGPSAPTPASFAGSDDDNSDDGGSDDGAGFGASGGDGTGATNGSTSGSGNGAGGGSAGGNGNGGGAAAPMGLSQVGSLVILGDSIGDGGGQGPYYDQLLHGSLQQKYGAVQLVNEADSGSKSSALPGQIAGLPPALPGPVVVAITTGGNDMKDALGLVLTGLDGVAVQTMGNNIGAALDLLLAPGRFGSGVEVHVYEASIYDASDGQGNFGSGGCVVNLDGPPTDPMFDKWNDAIAEPLMLRGQTLVPMHDHFYGHGFNNPPNWYAGDCTHPNSTGHDELHALFYQSITGESL